MYTAKKLNSLLWTSELATNTNTQIEQNWTHKNHGQNQSVQSEEASVSYNNTYNTKNYTYQINCQIPHQLRVSLWLNLKPRVHDRMSDQWIGAD